MSLGGATGGLAGLRGGFGFYGQVLWVLGLRVYGLMGLAL